MPNAAFFRLTEEKRRRILDAVWQEFTACSYADASINRIIAAAGISRGSFYQYFPGKQDLFAFLLDTLMQAVSDLFRAHLTAHSNDPFAAVISVYDTMIWKKAHARENQTQLRLQRLLELNSELDFSQFTAALCGEASLQRARQLLAGAGCEPDSPDQCEALVRMVLSIFLSGLTSTYRHPEQGDRCRTLLLLQLELLRRGLTVKKETL